MKARLLRVGLPVLALGILWLASQSVYIVDQTQRVLVVRLGRAQDLADAPGLRMKIPLVDTVTFFDKRLLPLRPPAVNVILGDRKRIDAEVFGEYRIADPLRFYRAAQSPERGRAQLESIVTSALRRTLGQVELTDLLSDRRDRAMDDVKAAASGPARALGIDLVAVRLRRADLPAETRQAVYDRMTSERQREAREIRAQGAEAAGEITVKAERERADILADADRQSRTDRGAGEAEANRLYAEASGAAPEFFRFYRSLQTYRGALAEAAPTLVLSPEASFLRLLANGPGPAGPSPATAAPSPAGAP